MPTLRGFLIDPADCFTPPDSVPAVGLRPTEGHTRPCGLVLHVRGDRPGNPGMACGMERSGNICGSGSLLHRQDERLLLRRLKWASRHSSMQHTGGGTSSGGFRLYPCRDVFRYRFCRRQVRLARGGNGLKPYLDHRKPVNEAHLHG